MRINFIVMRQRRVVARPCNDDFLRARNGFGESIRMLTFGAVMLACNDKRWRFARRKLL